MPSNQIKTALQKSESETASLPVIEEQKESRPQEKPQVIAATPADPHFCNIEETIDELERRIKAEEARYARLVANRQLYEHYMEPSDFRGLMRESAFRLVNFDPNFDLPCEACPLPTPWELPRQSSAEW